eukprot:g35371.t1
MKLTTFTFTLLTEFTTCFRIVKSIMHLPITISERYLTCSSTEASPDVPASSTEASPGVHAYRCQPVDITPLIAVFLFGFTELI